jgi:hypothetical protein
MRLKLLVPTATLLTMFAGSQVFASPVIVACGPGQHTIVRTGYARGEQVTRVVCVGNSYRSPRAVRYYETTRYGYRRPHRSWGKSALVIGGSASTGAGFGGLVGGKKGALAGAALGGGLGSLYEGAHRR